MASLEQRISLPGIRIPFADVGLAGFVDAGRMWAGEVPYGADSNWEAGVGVGIRIGVPAAGDNVFRVDLGIPLTGQREEKGASSSTRRASDTSRRIRITRVRAC